MLATAPNARRGRAMIGWVVLLLLSQAASLVLIRAGRIVGYQHYDLARLAADGIYGAATMIIIFHIVAVNVGMVLAFRGPQPWTMQRFPKWALLVALGAMLGLSAIPSLDPWEYASELVLAFGLQAFAILNVVLIARSAPEPFVRWWQSLGGKWLGERGDRPVPARFLDRTAVVAAVWTLLVCVLLVVFVYERIPHVPDEIVYVMQARYFAAGQLALPPPPVPQAFDVDLMYLDDTRWFSPVPPGWPALLAIGAAARVAWLVNPVLAALAVLLAHSVLRGIYAPRVARAATLLLAASPWLLFLGMSFMTHVAALVFALAAALGVARARRTGATWPTLVGGLCVGVVSLIRPLEGLAVALLLGFWSLGAKGRSWRLAPSAALVLGTVAATALVRPYNAALTGSASRFPIMMYIDRYYAPGSNDMGFGANRGLGWGALDPFPGHGVRDVIVNGLLNSVSINVELFGWATGSLCLILAFFALHRWTRADWWMLAVVAVVAGIHSFYWFSGGPDFAARYWFLAIVPLVALTASAIDRLPGDKPETRARFSLGVAAATAAAVLIFVPWRGLDKYRHFRRMEPGLSHLAEARGMHGGIVLVRGPRHPDYHAAAIFNPIDLKSQRTVFAWDRSRAIREQVVRAYPDRQVWLVDGPTVTRRGYELRAGPLPPGSLAPELPATDSLQSLTRRDRPR